MISYYLLLIFSLLFLLLHDFKQNLKKFYFENEFKILFIILLFIFVGFRSKVGSDWNSYNDIFYHWKKTNYELGFKYLIKISKIYNTNIWGLNIFSSFIFFLGFYFLFFKEKLFWLALALSLPYLIFVVSMGYLRQSVSIGIGMLLISQIRKGNILSQMILLFLCVLFHYTSIIYFFFIFYKIKNWFYKILIIILSFTFLYILTNEFADLNRYLIHYLISADKLKSSGAVPRLLLAYIPIVFFIFYYRKIKNNEYKYLFESYTLFLIILSILIFFSTTSADRLLLYVLPIKIFLILKSIELLNIRFQNYFKYTLVFIFFLSFHIQLTFSTNLKEWIPYKNILLSTQYDNNNSYK